MEVPAALILQQSRSFPLFGGMIGHTMIIIVCMILFSTFLANCLMGKKKYLGYFVLKTLSILNTLFSDQIPEIYPGHIKVKP